MSTKGTQKATADEVPNVDTADGELNNVEIDVEVNSVNIEDEDAENIDAGDAVVETQTNMDTEEKETDGAKSWTIVDESGEGAQRSEKLNVENVAGSASRSSRNMLYRHPESKAIGGVCGGLADFLGWEPALVRILWVGATLASGGSGILAYLALWILLPVGTTEQGQVRPASFELTERNMARAAYGLIGVGVLWLLANLEILPWLWGAFWAVVGTIFWPALLIGIGYLLLTRDSGQDWKANLRNTRERFRSRFNGNMPERGEVRSSLSDARQRLPLKRSKNDRIFAGVCGGIGQKIGVDANLVRLIWAAFSIGSIGMGVLVYVITALLLPSESADTDTVYSDDVQDVVVVEGTVKSAS